MKIVAKIGGICRLGNNTIQGEASRMDWLDALRALAMLFVIYGHLYKRDAFFAFVNPIKIPLFFAISGYLLYGKTGDAKAFSQRILHRIIVPWLILTLGFGFRFVFTQGLEFYVNFSIETIVGQRSWYMICCIIAQILFYFLQKLTGSGWKLGIAVLLITAAGFLLSTLGVGDLFQFRTALICQSYLLIGYWIKKYEDKILDMKLWMCLTGLGIYVALVFGCIFLFPGRSIDVHMDSYCNIPYCFLMLTVGCLALFACAQRIKKYPRWLCAIGRNTLVFYVHNVFWLGVVSRGLSLLGITMPKTWYGALVRLALCCVGCGFEAYILNRFFPEANGKKRKKKAVEAI